MNQGATLDFAELLADVDAESLFSATVTIQEFDSTLGPSGIERKDVDANWDNVTDHVDLECMVAADIFMTRITQSSEQRTQEYIAGKDLQHCLLNGRYPAITKKMRAVVTRGAVTRTFDIAGVEEDSQSVMTRLALRRVDL